MGSNSQRIFLKLWKITPIFSYPPSVSNEHAFLASLIKKCLCFKKFHVTPKIVIREISEKDTARKLITNLHLSAVFSSHKVPKESFVSVIGYLMQNLWNQPWQNKFEFWKLLGPFSPEHYMPQSLSLHF